MHRAGYILTGGRSSRMGREKALLPFEGTPLVLRVAQILEPVTGQVSLVGRADAFGHLGLRVIEDRYLDCGPLGGIHAALSDTGAEWNLLVACDMPLLDGAFLESLFQLAMDRQPAVAMARNPAGLPEPLCAVYRRACLPTVESALRAGKLKITAALESLAVCLLDVPRPQWVANANTPGDWERILKGEAPVD